MPKKQKGGVTLVTQQEIANEFGITTSAIRKYEDKGLIKPTETTQQGTLEYKWYDEKTIFRIRMIRMYVEMGEKLDQIKEMLTDPGFDSASEIEKLRKGLVKQKAKITRQIAFCDLVELYGAKIATLMTSGENSVESFMGKVLKKWKKTGVLDKIRKMESSVADEQLSELNRIVFEINEMSRLPYTNDQIQKHVLELIDKWTDFEHTTKELSGNPRLGYRLFYLLSGILITVGGGVFTRNWQKRVGEVGVKYLSYAFLYAMMRTINELIDPFRMDFNTLTSENEKEEFVNQMYKRLVCWLQTIALENQVPEEEMKEMLRDLVEDSDSSDFSEEGCDEVYEMIMEEIRQLD